MTKAKEDDAVGVLDQQLTEEKGNGVPPVDAGGEMHLAGVLLKRFRHQMQPLPTNWQVWIADSLRAGITP